MRIIQIADNLKGGLADKKTPQDIADKHGVSLAQILEQIEMGIKVEKEHVDNPSQCREIAMDHLWEDPEYYTKLAKMEAGAVFNLRIVEANAEFEDISPEAWARLEQKFPNITILARSGEHYKKSVATVLNYLSKGNTQDILDIMTIINGMAAGGIVPQDSVKTPQNVPSKINDL